MIHVLCIYIIKITRQCQELNASQTYIDPGWHIGNIKNVSVHIGCQKCHHMGMACPLGFVYWYCMVEHDHSLQQRLATTWPQWCIARWWLKWCGNNKWFADAIIAIQTRFSTYMGCIRCKVLGMAWQGFKQGIAQKWQNHGPWNTWQKYTCQQMAMPKKGYQWKCSKWHPNIVIQLEMPKKGSMHCNVLKMSIQADTHFSVGRMSGCHGCITWHIMALLVLALVVGFLPGAFLVWLGITWCLGLGGALGLGHGFPFPCKWGTRRWYSPVLAHLAPHWHLTLMARFSTRPYPGFLASFIAMMAVPELGQLAMALWWPMVASSKLAFSMACMVAAFMAF